MDQAELSKEPSETPIAVTSAASAHEYSYELKIPEERIAVLIGAAGKTKKEIEEASGCTLAVSKEGDVEITGTDALLLYTTREIVRAIARGFNPQIALQLLKSDFVLEVIDLTDVAAGKKNVLERLRGRIIGSEGKSRREIEQLSNTSISVYGKTVAIIGDVAQVELAREAVAMLVRGSMHRTVYQFLERKRKEMMRG
ncbi:MAG: KH domain-containing protein [Nanoarchaeota archaeon]